MILSFVSILLAALLNWIGNVDALYEDQIGKFDWKKEFVGPVKFSTFSKFPAQGDVVFVGTEQNVIASLSLKTGNVVWRKVLEKGDRGFITHFCLINNGVFAITGKDVIQVRGWHSKNGYLTHHWSLQESSSKSVQILWHIEDLFVYKLTLTSTRLLNYSKYRLHNGDLIIEESYPLSTNFFNNCAINKAILLCLKNGRALTADVTATEFKPKELKVGFSESLSNSLKAVGNDITDFVSIENEMKLLLHVNPSLELSKLRHLEKETDAYSTVMNGETSKVIIIVKRQSKYTVEVEGYLSGNLDPMFKKRYILKFPVGEVSISNVQCSKSSKEVIECLILLSNDDASLILLRDNGKVEWIREEALSNIVTAEMIELPMSDTEAEMQTEFDTNESDVVSMFTHRITSHFFQLQKSLLGLSGILEKSFSSESSKDNKFVRDYFNLHKIILVVTKQMKIYAIDNISKEILWSYLLDDEFEPFPAPTSAFEVRVPLFVQRSYRHFPHPLMSTILVRDRTTKNGVIFVFNPIKGKFETPVKLRYKIKQAMLLPKQTSEDFIQGIALLDENNNIHLFPEHTKSVLKDIAPNLFFYVADAESCQVNGYGFGSDLENTTMISVWSMQCTGKIIKMYGKNPIEKVHSQGRVLPDRSVLYKYINPNLITIVSQSINPEDQKSMLTLYLVDSVTGTIVNGDVRHRASSPVYLVHSENWVVLIYSNEKARRTEIVTYELYEGKKQHNSTAFSSIQAKSTRPIVDSRAYILPTGYVEAAKETITEKGITSKHVLVALSSGNIIELPWIILDPRRPFANSPETKEEGVIPYMPEIPIHTESMINYNQTLYRVEGILTSPSGLESTSLTFVYGLDLFYTRVSPSKTFDLLKEDFDYMLIIIVLVLLSVLTVVTKHFAYRRALKQAWR